MKKVALIEKWESDINYDTYLPFPYDHYYLSSSVPENGKLYKKHIDIEFAPEEYDIVILVGAEPTKHYVNNAAVTTHQGLLLDDKFIPLVSPALVQIKPENKSYFDMAITSIIDYVKDRKKVAMKRKLYGITDEQDALDYLRRALKEATVIAIDTETTALYPRDGYVLGISLAYKIDEGVYIDSDIFSDECVELLQQIIYTKKIIFHNAKFDIKMLQYHFGLKIALWGSVDWEDTMLLHYLLNETPGTHSLKDLAGKHTDLGDYERDLEEYKKNKCKELGIPKKFFTYDLIPFDIMFPYAATDAVATLELYFLFEKYVAKDPKLSWAYRNLLIQGTELLIRIEEYGIPMCADALVAAQEQLSLDILEATKAVYEYEEIKRFEEHQGAKLNLNSVVQLRKLLFGADYFNLTPTGILTGSKQHSLNKEALKLLSKKAPIAADILKVRALTKIKNTYIDKIIPALDMDSRVRTNFNLSMTTSGRLSSSGKLNAQQFPRDNKAVKGCIKANDGYVITSQDLSTAEMYVAAVLSGDLELQKVFTQKGDFHSNIACLVFGADCHPDEVKAKFPELRQASKAISFGILFGAGPAKVADVAKCTIDEAMYYINTYFEMFPRLKQWIAEERKKFMKHNAGYSVFGRKRRLKNLNSPNNGVVGHDLRSGINFLIQSVASDINLLATIEMQKYIEERNWDIKIFAMVHDSIVAEVPIELVEEYKEKLQEFTQKDRGITIPGCPIGLDFEVSHTYAMETNWESIKQDYLRDFSDEGYNVLDTEVDVDDED